MEIAVGILVLAVLAYVFFSRADRAGALDDPRRDADGGGF